MSVTKKLMISFFSLIIFLGLLEVSLRFAGHLHSLSRKKAHSEKGEAAPGEGQYTILCLGDSYTYGGNLPSDQVYPPRLQKILTQNHPHQNYSVINAGVCEYNSKQVLTRLSNWVKKYNPDMIILLVGATDMFNFAGYDFQDRGIRGLIYNLRIYKMFKIIRLNLKAKKIAQKTSKSRDFFSQEGFYARNRDDFIKDYFEERKKIKSYSESQSYLENAWYYYYSGEREKAIKIIEEFLAGKPDSVVHLLDLAHFYYYVPEEKRHSPPHHYLDEERIEKARQLYKRAESITSDSDFVLAHLAHFYRVVGEDYLARNKHDLAIALLLKSIEIDPLFYFPYYLVVRAQEFQSRYDASYIVAAFEKMAKGNPELKKSSLFVKYLNFFKDRNKWETLINKQIKKNLKKIVEFCRENDIELVIQNYPYPYAIANQILNDIAVKYSLPFVDNRGVFEQLVQEKGWEKYFHFYTDEHCSPEGYQTMAENIYKVLSKKVFLAK